jgi:hypothetical protein
MYPLLLLSWTDDDDLLRDAFWWSPGRIRHCSYSGPLSLFVWSGGKLIHPLLTIAVLLRPLLLHHHGEMWFLATCECCFLAWASTINPLLDLELFIVWVCRWDLWLWEDSRDLFSTGSFVSHILYPQYHVRLLIREIKFQITICVHV